jgi:hypothetical protein
MQDYHEQIIDFTHELENAIMMKYTLLQLLIFCLLPSIMQGQVTKSDSPALVALHHNTNGQSWTNHTNWLQPGQPDSTWNGILEHDTIIDRIYLDQNNLTGVLPTGIYFISLSFGNLRERMKVIKE